MDATARRIVDAALSVFADRGYHGTAVPLVAERAGVGTGTIYRHFSSKEALVNAVFRDAKTRLAAAIYDGLDMGQPADRLVVALFERLAGFAAREVEAFHFLELQDHVPYLDEESLSLETKVLAPIFERAVELSSEGRLRGLPPDVAIAAGWGAFVGVFKAARLGYLELDDERMDAVRGALTALLREEGSTGEPAKRPL